MDNYQEIIATARENVKKYEKNSEVAQISFMAIDAFEEIKKIKILNDENLKKIIDVLICHGSGAIELGIKLLGELVEEYPQINDEMRTLENSKSGHIRKVAITALYDDRFSYDLSLELVKKALNDKSAKVREFAVDRAFVRALNPLLPDLMERVKIEENKTVLDSLNYVISIMEQQVK